MEYIELILESLLKEEARQADVIDAIKKRYEVGINYKADNDTKGKGYRIIQPVAYGKTSKGNLVVRAFQPFGDTKTKTPHWKLFRLDRIDKWKPLKKRKFKEPPQPQYGEQGKFNPDGDGSMSEVYLVANFNGMRNDALMKYNQSRFDQKTKENPYYGLQQNIKKSIKGNDIDYVRKNVEDWQNSQAAKEFKGNGKSIYDMSRINRFGDDNMSQTVGPVRKDNTETSQENNSSKLNYQKASNNGPVYKHEPEDVENDNGENNIDFDDQEIDKNDNR